ncbi:MAG: cation acetate symporter [Planctomycetaceae bacterium]|nr:MAG: cation acetate symporter [Planctomycetaceae bacterium]
MTEEVSLLSVLIFVLLVAGTIGLSFFLGRKTQTSEGYFAAHGQVPWAINGIAFAGDYLSAASFLGICGMIAFYGYDGFLYSIGYLAGWIVALFVIAEPMKRLGRFTFADALDSRFDSRGIKLAAGISTLVVSVFYLIPQMVGAGVLIQPLLNLPHWAGVMMVGAVVIVIVVTAGMVSTTWVQFLKGSMLVVFSLALTVMVLQRGLQVDAAGADGQFWQSLGPFSDSELVPGQTAAGREVLPTGDGWEPGNWVRLADPERGGFEVFTPRRENDLVWLDQAQAVTVLADKTELVDGVVRGTGDGQKQMRPGGHVSKLSGGRESTGPLGPMSFFRELQDSEVVVWRNRKLNHADGSVTTVHFQVPTEGGKVLRPGEHPTFAGIRTGRTKDRLEFLSLMLALFCGTASLPHILIRYYTVKDEAAARKSTIVGITSIGVFYVSTLYLGLGAMTSGALDVEDSNMAAPLLARSLSPLLFAIISAVAFTTVLGTVSGLILASSGAVAHDLITGFLRIPLTGHQQVRVAKIAAVIVGAIAIVLGILFAGLNVSYLVGWAFSIAASANLPALTMLLFWKGTTRQGIIASVIVGMVSSLGWILLSAEAYSKVYGLPPEAAWAPLSQPGIVTIPLSFLTLIVVSLATRTGADEDQSADAGGSV